MKPRLLHYQRQQKGKDDANIVTPTVEADPVEEGPISVDEDPMSVEEAPMSLEEDPMSVEEDPMSVEEDPMSVEEAPMSLEEAPVSVEEETLSEDLITDPVNSSVAAVGTNEDHELGM